MVEFMLQKPKQKLLKRIDAVTQVRQFLREVQVTQVEGQASQRKTAALAKEPIAHDGTQVRVEF